MAELKQEIFDRLHDVETKNQDSGMAKLVRKASLTR